MSETEKNDYVDRKVKIIDQDGNIQYVEPKDLKKGSIITTDLNDEQLKRISQSFDVFKDVLDVETDETMKTKEQFEITFMRSDDPNRDILTWERMATTYKMAQHYFGDAFEVRRVIFRIMMWNIIDALSEEEKQREDVQLVIRLFNGTAKQKSAQSGKSNNSNPTDGNDQPTSGTDTEGPFAGR